MKEIRVSKKASEGIAVGRAFLVERDILVPVEYAVEEVQKEGECKRFKQALLDSAGELRALSEKDEVFAAHLEIVKDETLFDGVCQKIMDEGKNAEKAFWEIMEDYIAVFQSMEDEYMRERAADILDVRNRIMEHLKGRKKSFLSDEGDKVILVAENLYPSDTAFLDNPRVLGFITQKGSMTSHISIMAKNRGVPALVGAEGILEEAKQDDLIILDAGEGRILINPDEGTCRLYREKKRQEALRAEQYLSSLSLPACTKDGRRVKVYGNAGNLEEVKRAVAAGMEGVGLFRSEFLYMEKNHFPTEEEQYLVYREGARLCKEGITIRTLDIGGDKKLPYFSFEEEENPFLGWRAIRISLAMREVFKAQLKAILRAGSEGKVRIMFPMLISLEEWEKAMAVIEECKEELKREGKAYKSHIPVGMMIETPAAVLLAEEFAKKADFFSIGTNDLTQYILAIDRGNKKMASQYDYFHPAVLSAVQMAIQAAHNEGIEAAMCGEMASDERAVPMLLQMGLDEFSIAPSQYPKVKYLIQNSFFHPHE